MILVRAPFRLPLGGGGTDLPSYYTRYGGFVLAAAINKYLYIYANRPAADELIRVKYSRYEQVSSPGEVQHDLVRPALRTLNVIGSLEIASMADVPGGTGLGSSSTYLVALLTALHELKREKVSTRLLAEESCHIEIELAGHPVGKQDHYAAAFGGIACFEIARDGAVQVSPLKMTIAAAEDFRSSVLLFFTNRTRDADEILSRQVEDTRNDDVTVVDSLHRTKELGYRIKEVLESGDLETFGRLLHEHWENKKRRCSKISDCRIDRWYDIARASGALGGKIMGAGGGGFFMFYCPNGRKQQLRNALVQEGLRELSYDFDMEGAKVLVNF